MKTREKLGDGSVNGAKLTILTELQVESLFYPCYNLCCKPLQNDVAVELEPRWLLSGSLMWSATGLCSLLGHFAYWAESRPGRDRVDQERFNKLCATYLHHQISEKLLIQYYYEGLTMLDRSMIDAASRGIDKRIFSRFTRLK
ncbi:hypothetical protein CR513_38073, partial [Mucuna pruriens]